MIDLCARDFLQFDLIASKCISTVLGEAANVKAACKTFVIASLVVMHASACGTRPECVGGLKVLASACVHECGLQSVCLACRVHAGTH